jgi:hypothetical protein
MQELGLGRGFRRGSLVYGDGNVGSTFFLHESENKVRSRRCDGALGFREEQRGGGVCRQRPPQLPLIYHSSDELRSWLCVGFKAEWLRE